MHIQSYTATVRVCISQNVASAYACVLCQRDSTNFCALLFVLTRAFVFVPAKFINVFFMCMLMSVGNRVCLHL